MASLTRVAYVSRKIIKFGGWGLIIFVTLWSGTKKAIEVYRAANPLEVPPTMRYGLLPKTVFIKKEFSKKNFRAELSGDTFPEFENQAKIFVIYRPGKDFLALEHDKKAAAGLGFNLEPVQIRYGVYEFKNANLNRVLTMNVLDGSFVLKYPYLEDQTLLSMEEVPSKGEAISLALSYLERGEKLTDDLKEGEQKASFWKIEPDGLKSVSSHSEANMVRVDFFRTKIDGSEVIVSQPNGSPVSVLVSGADMANKRIVEVNYKSMEIDQESFSTYPIKTVEDAWTDLESGNYWPASDTDNESVVIRNVYLAYFEPVVLTHFLQPVFVFEGSDNFVAYVTAVVDNSIEQVGAEN